MILVIFVFFLSWDYNDLHRVYILSPIAEKQYTLSWPEGFGTGIWLDIRCTGTRLVTEEVKEVC